MPREKGVKMKKKAVLLTFASVFLSTSLCVLGLLELQIAYASPYTNTSVGTAYSMITDGLYLDLVVLDVRTKSEYDIGHIYGAVWIPVTELETRIGELAGHENHGIIVYCRSGGRSVTASGILDSHNFTKVYNMLGGISAWQSAGYPVWIATVHNLNTTFNYDTIQAAIDAPQTSDGHTIFVEEGTYYEHVIVYKSLSLVGEDRTKTIIDGNLTEHVIEVTANNIKITGFTIQKSGCGCAAKSGVYIRDYHQNVNVTNNLIIQNGYGIKLDQAHNITIAGNNITNNAYDGLYLSWSFDNTIFGNNIKANTYGIILYDSSNNSIYHNNFLNNTSQVYSYNSVNFWDNDYPSGGNYWSDYTDVDLYSGPHQNVTGSDGIGDTPYVIDENNRDNYPLMTPWTPPIPKLYTDPSQVTCRKYCENFKTQINITDAINLEDFEFEIHYNATLLDYVSVTWNAWGAGFMDSSTDGILIGSTSGTQITGNLTLVTIEFHVGYKHIWKDCPGWTSILTGKIYFQWANLSYPSGPDLAYVRGELYEIDVGPDVAYTFMPIQGDIDNDGSVSILDISLVAWYYEQAYPAYDLNCDGIIDIFDLVIIAANLWYEYDC